ncbi:hypothetical protein V6Z12_A06G206600 [Gossypium hirsutum]
MIQEKKLVEEVSGWLRVYDDGSVDRTWTGPPEVKFMAEPVSPHEQFIDGIATRDVTIDQNSGLRARIYLPEEENPKFPIILHFPGGGFCISQADWFMYYQFYSRLAKSIPAIVVSVYLRLAPENKLPAACDDGYAALLWLKSLSKAEKDLIKDTEMEYYELLKKANKDVELFHSTEMGHSFYLNKIAIDTDPVTAAQTSELIEGIKVFINKHGKRS